MYTWCSQVVWHKVSVVDKIVNWGFNVLHSDVDAVWFQDPLPYFLGPKCQYVDFAVSTGGSGAGHTCTSGGRGDNIDFKGE